MTKICIIGVDGQDGSFLAEHFAGKNFEVIGIGRRQFNFESEDRNFLKYEVADLSFPHNLDSILQRINPELIIYCASIHGPSGFDYFMHSNDTYLVNSFAPHICLEFCRRSKGNCSFTYFSSIKVFSVVSKKGSLISPWDCRQATDLYSRSKIIVEDSIRFYRDTFDVQASVIWLSNHESIKRIHKNYFLPKFLRQFYLVTKSGVGFVNVRSLDFYCDWGCASQFMEIVAEHAVCNRGKDLFIGTNQFVHARELVKDFLSVRGIDYRRLVLEESENRNISPPGRYVFRDDWLPNKKNQDELLGPRAVMEKIYNECSPNLFV